MNEKNVIKVLKSELEFRDSSIDKLKLFHDYLLDYNKRYNLISKSTEKSIWFRHILDSAQLLKFLKGKKPNDIADFGSGAGFPGIILAIQSQNKKFHVKLYEKSSVKREFLNITKKKIRFTELRG